MNVQPSIQVSLDREAFDIETLREQQLEAVAARPCQFLIKSTALTAASVGGILGIAAAAMQIENPGSPAGSVVNNTAIAAVVGNIMAMVGTGIERDSVRDLGARPFFAKSLGVLVGIPATVANALSLAALIKQPGMASNDEHTALTTAALAMTGLATLINIGFLLKCKSA